jgi:tetratricopeptide (TPR) repeat protein
LQLLKGGAKDRPTRQQTLRNTIDWSYALLSPDEQRLFARLSVFAGGCTPEAAEAVCNSEGDLEIDVLDELAALVDKSLLRQEGEEDLRFRMLETIREYATERLEESGEAEQLRRSYADHFLAFAEQAERELIEGQQAAWLSHLEAEHANVQAALEWSLGREQAVEQGLRLTKALERFWLMRGYVSEQCRWLHAALEKAERAPVGVRARLLLQAANLERSLGDRHRARSLCDQSLTLFRDVGDKQGMSDALIQLGEIALDHGNHEKAAALHEHSLALRREVGHRSGIAQSLGYLGSVARLQGDYPQARSLFQEAVTLQRKLGDTSGVAQTLLKLALAVEDQGDYVRAVSLLEETRRLAEDLGNKRMTATVLNNLGYVALLQGEYERANALCTKSVALLRALEDRRKLAAALHSLGRVRQEQGDQEGAREALTESLKLVRQVRIQSICPYLLETLASLAGGQGRAERAARLFGAAESARQAMKIPMRPSERPFYQRWVAAARLQLAETTWSQAWEAGQVTSLEEAVAYALDESA